MDLQLRVVSQCFLARAAGPSQISLERAGAGLGAGWRLPLATPAAGLTALQGCSNNMDKNKGFSVTLDNQLQIIG